MLTQSRLKELLDYNPDTGIWTWKVDRLPGAKAGDRAGRINSKWGYRYICVDKTQYQSSRLVCLYMTGEWPKQQMDHKNRDPNDDRWENLRDVSASINQCNRGIPRNNKSGSKGVVWHKGKNKWMAQIRLNRKNIYLGIYEHKHDAIMARLKAEKEYHLL